jgi:hypothetical protein
VSWSTWRLTSSWRKLPRQNHVFHLAPASSQPLNACELRGSETATMGIGNSSHDSDNDASRDDEDERRPIPPKHILSPVGSPDYVGNILDSTNPRNREGVIEFHVANFFF